MEHCVFLSHSSKDSAIADNLAAQGRLQEARSAYLALELEMEKSFGSECPQILRLREKGAAI